MIANLAFTTPLLLLALVALPILWWLLRAVPPAPIRRRFPGVALLLGLQDDESQTDKTPWWLLLLRMLAIAAAIVGFAGPRAEPPDRAGGRWTVADRDGCVLGLGAGLGRPDRAGQRPAGRGWPVGPARGHRRIDRPAGRASGIPVCKCLGGPSAIGIPGALRAGLCGGGGLDREPRRGGGRLLGLRRTGP